MQIDLLDIYHQHRGVNGSNQGLVQYPDFHFVFREGCQNFKRKYSNHIFNESINTDTCACAICWLIWMPF